MHMYNMNLLDTPTLNNSPFTAIPAAASLFEIWSQAIAVLDPYTRNHSSAAACLSLMLARELGWQYAQLELLMTATLLHDIGKALIPIKLLNKKEPLSSEDWGLIKMHPVFSARIILSMKNQCQAVPYILHHHEWWDGKGYPYGLKGSDIPLGARIIAITDAFDAMTTDRPYRKAWSITSALAELRECAGSQFDPELVNVFANLIEKNTNGKVKSFY